MVWYMSNRQPESPSLDPDKAIELLRNQLAKQIEKLPYDDPQVYRWWNTTANIIREAFGADHPNVGEFSSSYSTAQTRQEHQQEHLSDISQRKALLEGFIEQLETMTPKKPSVSMSLNREGVYFAGQQFDAMLRVSKLLSDAKVSITIIDGYIGEDVLALLSSKAPSVTVSILTKPLPPALGVIARAFNSQHGGLTIRSSQAFHDRFVIIDDTEFYHFGASIKDLGKRGFMFSKIEEPEMIDAVRKKFQSEWTIAKTEV